MLALETNTLLILFVFIAMIAGYFIGVLTESEIEKIAGKLRIDKVFSPYTIVAEIAILLALFSTNDTAYYVSISVIMIINLILSAMHSASKSDLVKVVGYAVLFTVPLLVGSFVISLV